MITLFRADKTIYAVGSTAKLSDETSTKLKWLFSKAQLVAQSSIEGNFIGPRREIITPWSTNAVEITQTMGIEDITRIEQFHEIDQNSTQESGIHQVEDIVYDKMLSRLYTTIDLNIFTVDTLPEPIVYIDNIREYNQSQGLALVEQEIEYLENLSRKLERKLTDSEVFGFSQVNSEHCRHKIFNGEFVIDGHTMPETLFAMIRKTTKEHNGTVVSAYTDNCAFLQGSVVEQFAPATHDTADYFVTEDFESVITIKAETHNFPTTVEPFNGAATGSGGEIRDRIAGGKGAFPMSGTACYMTAYPRLGRSWEQGMAERPWLYQTPAEILIKASNGASDFGNKFGQPLITGSLYTFEHQENDKKFGFDKVIMLAGGIGYGKKIDALKDLPTAGDKVVLLGGDNYRIGMGGGAVSSVATGEYANAIEMNAIQRSNPEMQKRAYNAIRAISEEANNPIISIHDHGAGGHLNCLSELVEHTGGRIDLECLPIGDPTLSDKEIVGNESQERMGLVIKEEYIAKFRRIAERERAPFYVIGETTGDMQFTFINNKTGAKPIDMQLADFFGKTPRTQLVDNTIVESYEAPQYQFDNIDTYINNVLQIESVACKDWLTNKVDRSVTGRVAMQQCAGEIQLPLNDCGVIALDFHGTRGIANSLGHATAVAMADPAKGSVMAIAESLTNLIFAPINGGLGAVSLSANWMWPCKNAGEDARLYKAVRAASDFAIELGLNIPTGKDSLSMTQKYPDGDKVYAPGTVIITAVGEVTDIKKCVKAALQPIEGTEIVYIDLSGDKFHLGGSAFAQTLNTIGDEVPTVQDAKYFARGFNAIQQIIEQGTVLAGHDISSGGLVTALLEMNFANASSGMEIDLNVLRENDIIKILFSERPSILLQVVNGSETADELSKLGVAAQVLGKVTANRRLTLRHDCCTQIKLDIDTLRDVWYKTSYELDKLQSTEVLASDRFANYKNQKLTYNFPAKFQGTYASYGIDPHRKTSTGTRAAIIREKGSNGDREMAWAMHLAGFDVKDVHMTDLISGRETLEDINLIVFVGGFSNSDVLNSGKGWAGAFLYNPRAKAALDNYFKRPDTLSLAVCNGCQLVVELGLINPNHSDKAQMGHNESRKFESNFVNVVIENGPSIMLKSLEGSRLGLWIAHGEGKFKFPYSADKYNIAMRYGYAQYPANPNGSDYNTAAICSSDGRHLAMMPHPERAMKPWNCAHYPTERAADEVTPWIEMFINAKQWIQAK